MARHAEATRVEVALNQNVGKIRLEIRDNGKGFDADSWRPDTSLGLIGIRERALSLGGHLAIRSVSGQGTVVTVSVPVPAPVLQ